MAVSYVTFTNGNYRAFGLSTDTKPVSPTENSMFVETDTARMFTAISGAWVLIRSQFTVSTTAPTSPISGDIWIDIT